MSNKIDIKIVEEYIKCLTTVFPTNKQVDFIKKYREDIEKDKKYNYLVKEAIEDIEAAEEFYRTVKNSNLVIDVDSVDELNKELAIIDQEETLSHKIIGGFKIIGGKITEIIDDVIKESENNNFKYKISFQPLVPVLRGESDINDGDVYVDYDKLEHEIILYASTENNYYLRIDDNLIKAIDNYYDDTVNMNVYVFSINGIEEDRQFDIIVDEE